MGDAVYLTEEKFLELQQKLVELKTKGRKEVAQKIAEARSHGDLSENSEYDAAKHQQELLEIEIAKLEATLSKAQVIRPEELPNDKVYILSKVKVKNLKLNKVIEYMLVSPEEADFEKGKISVTSPIGKALLGKKTGDVVEFQAPAGKTQLEILEINR
ncbi:MAG: transcription elongation factor GreA [Ignavibacteria bacterium]|nr:transcription elongation factor GreA [Ignavibacteria bacterium]